MRITNDTFDRLLKDNGWAFAGNAWTVSAPYDKTIKCYLYRREFTDGKGNKLGTIINLRDVIWDYDPNTGLLQNGVFAIRVK